jgi:hypothetical protein
MTESGTWQDRRPTTKQLVLVDGRGDEREGRRGGRGGGEGREGREGGDKGRRGEGKRRVEEIESTRRMWPLGPFIFFARAREEEEC